MPYGNKQGHMLDRTTHLFISGWNTHAAQGGGDAHCYKSLISVQSLHPADFSNKTQPCIDSAHIGLGEYLHASFTRQYVFFFCFFLVLTY